MISISLIISMTSEVSTLSLHDALPIWQQLAEPRRLRRGDDRHRVEAGDHGAVEQVVEQLGRLMEGGHRARPAQAPHGRSEEHTSELQSRLHLVCRLLLEKKKIGLLLYY